MSPASTPKRAARLVLASQSPGRLATLRSAGIEPIVIVSHVDEDAIEAALPDASPADLVCALAEAKARAVAREVADRLRVDPSWGETRLLLVLGGDSMLEVNGRMVGKPLTPEVARTRIREMQETDSVLWTGHSLVPIVTPQSAGADEGPDEGGGIGSPLTAASSTIVHFGTMTDAEIDAYVATGEPLQVAGSFTIDGLGGPFVRGVTGDPHAVVGVSLPLVRTLAQEAGVFWPDLWR